MTYTTGISGTQGTPNADGTENDTQNIVVNTNSATLNINGAGGVDKFNIEASSFTKSLTIAGNLGTVPDHQEVLGNYDTVRIDLSKTSGVNLDISKLLVSNPNNEGIVITSSKGADNITLVAGANHDVIEFKAGGGLAPQQEEYTVDLGNLRLAAGQSFTIDGLTITNTSGFDNAASGVTAATIYTGEAIAELLRAYLTDGASATVTATAGGILSSGSAVTKYIQIEGSLESLTTKNGWLTDSGAATVSVLNKTSLVFRNTKTENVTDLNFTFSGNDKTNGLASEVNKAQEFTAGKAGVSAQTTATGSYTAIGSGDMTSGTSKQVILNIGSAAYTITFAASGGGATADIDAATVAKVINGGTAGITNVTATISGPNSATSVTLPTGITISGDSSGFTVSGLESGGDTITIAGTEYAYAPATEDIQGTLIINFGDGLVAGQSYTFLDKTVIATKDLTGEEIAEAFAFGIEGNSGVEGAVVLGEWSQAYTSSGGSSGSSGGIDPSKLLFDISGSSLILMEQAPGSAQGLLLSGFPASMLNLKGTGTLAVRTDKVTGETTQQGEKDSIVSADSYVTFAGVGTGSAASGADAGTVTAIKATTNALDTITNFDISNDKLLLKDVDGNVLSFTRGGSVTSPTDIFVDTFGSTLTASDNGGGMISFGITAGSGAATTADAITLDQKLYAAVNGVSSSGVVGFEHGGDTYVILEGDSSGASTADLVIKLAGVTGVTDITSILA